jgi:hypothetical protein
MQLAAECLAYIDANAGSILVQLLIGSVVGMGVLLRQSLYRLWDALVHGQGADSLSGNGPARGPRSD